jgi:hypothetical protein
MQQICGVWQGRDSRHTTTAFFLEREASTWERRYFLSLVKKLTFHPFTLLEKLS